MTQKLTQFAKDIVGTLCLMSACWTLIILFDRFLGLFR
jgi:hypothetical protein